MTTEAIAELSMALSTPPQIICVAAVVSPVFITPGIWMKPLAHDVSELIVLLPGKSNLSAGVAKETDSW